MQGSTPPDRNALSSMFVGSATAFDEIPGHFGTQAPPTPAAARRTQPRLSTTTAVDQSPNSPTPATPLDLRAAVAPTKDPGPGATTTANAETVVVGKTRERAKSGTLNLGECARAGTSTVTGREAEAKPRRLVLERFSLYETKTVSH